VAVGQHMEDAWGRTVVELEREFHDEPWALYRIPTGAGRVTMCEQLGHAMRGLEALTLSLGPDMILVHGDRVEAIAGAQVGALHNVLVGHVEGGEVSGTVDESLRHAVTKLAHVHFVANTDARSRLRRMGEDLSNVHVIGSPEVDVMVGELPEIGEVRERYEIPDGEYGVVIYHPVTTYEPAKQHSAAEVTRLACTSLAIQWVALHPNADHGHEYVRPIMCTPDHGWRAIPSMRHTHFLRLMKDAAVLVGNSSAGVREAPVYGTPTVNVGPRQQGRALAPHIEHVGDERELTIRRAIDRQRGQRHAPHFGFGEPGAAARFMKAIECPETWGTPKQKTWRAA
jgi:UDP-N-acetylglucosamine 2-epimerase (hydrolysing)